MMMMVIIKIMMMIIIIIIIFLWDLLTLLFMSWRDKWRIRNR